MKKLAYILLITTGISCFSHYSKAQDSADYQQMEQLANQGNPEAQYNIGVMYDQGIGVPQNGNKAVEWYEKAAKQRLYQAEFNLGVLYDEGIIVPQDYSKAIQYYTQAAQQGDDQAMVNLGGMYRKG